MKKVKSETEFAAVPRLYLSNTFFLSIHGYFASFAIVHFFYTQTRFSLWFMLLQKPALRIFNSETMTLFKRQCETVPQCLNQFYSDMQKKLAFFQLLMFSQRNFHAGSIYVNAENCWHNNSHT